MSEKTIANEKTPKQKMGFFITVEPNAPLNPPPDGCVWIENSQSPHALNVYIEGNWYKFGHIINEGNLSMM